jgi:hypothetical protein
MDAITLSRSGETIKCLQSEHAPITVALRMQDDGVAQPPVNLSTRVYFDAREALSKMLNDQTNNPLKSLRDY